MQRLARHLGDAGLLRSGVDRPEALAQLMVLTSYGTYRELRQAGLSGARATRHLQAAARRLLGR